MNELRAARGRARSAKAVIVATALLAGLLPATHARASSAVVNTFMGKCHLSAPIGYPLLGVNKGQSIPFKCWFGVQPTVPGKNNSTPGFWVGIQTGAKITSSSTWGYMEGFVSPGQAGGPWCGHSTGSFRGVDSNRTEYSGSWLSSGGGVMVIVGQVSRGTQVGPLYGVAYATPDAVFKGQSCTTGATQFWVSGAMTGVKLGGGK